MNERAGLFKKEDSSQKGAKTSHSMREKTLSFIGICESGIEKVSENYEDNLWQIKAVQMKGETL